MKGRLSVVIRFKNFSEAAEFRRLTRNSANAILMSSPRGRLLAGRARAQKHELFSIALMSSLTKDITCAGWAFPLEHNYGDPSLGE